MTKWVDDLKKEYEDKISYADRLHARRPTAHAGTTDRRRPSRSVRASRRGARRAAGADAAAAPRLPVGSRADRADDRAAHGRGGLRGRRRRGARRPAKLLDELGDLLFQVYFLALLLEEQGDGDLEEVAAAVHAKLVRAASARLRRRRGEQRRAGARALGADQGRAGGPRGIFHDVPASLPALLQARKVQRRAAAVGFDWPDLDGPLAKVREELGELEAEVARGGEPAPETEPDARVVARGRRPALHGRQRRAAPERRSRARAADDERAASSRASSAPRSSRRRTASAGAS